MSNLNWIERKVARGMLRKQVPMDRIVDALGNKYFPSEIEADVAAMRVKERENRALYRKIHGPTVRASIIEPRSDVKITNAQITDRDHRRSLFPISTTAACMGDPLPGYSALDRAPSITPSIHHDPLDDLMFSRRKVGMRYG